MVLRLTWYTVGLNHWLALHTFTTSLTSQLLKLERPSWLNFPSLCNSSMAARVSARAVPWSGACRYNISTLATCGERQAAGTAPHL